jgi:hypothetical protein
MDPTVAGRRYDAALHFLDRQVVDPDGLLVAKVDEIELGEREDGRLLLTALLTGPGALGPRFGGRIGHWIVVAWRRLNPQTDPSPGRIDVSDIVRVDSAIHVGRRRDALGVDGFERWVDDHVTSRIPGATHEPE